jgi:hypothetical protein
VPSLGARGAPGGTREGLLKDRRLKGGFNPPNSKIWSKCRTHGFFSIFLGGGASCDSIVVSSIPRPQLLTELRAPTGGTNPPL